MKNKSHYPQPVNWRFWAGSEDVVVYVRKLKTASAYLISGAILPQSNVAGNAPEKLNVTINLAGMKLIFEVRRQGSVYSMTVLPTGELSVQPKARVPLCAARALSGIGQPGVTLSLR